MPKQSSHVVFRGAYRGLDPTYACLSHDAQERSYGVLHFEDGKLVSRSTFPLERRSEVEEFTSDSFGGGEVYVDTRSDSNLLPLKVGSRCKVADLDTFRRAKSDEEIREIQSLTRRARDALANPSSHMYRGARVDPHDGACCAFVRTEKNGFVEYRGGMRSKRGLVSDVTLVEPKNEKWRGLLSRVHTGMDCAMEYVRPGVSFSTIDEIVKSHLKDGDEMYGNVLSHQGYRSFEDLPTGKLQPFDVLKFGTVFGDEATGERASVFRGVVTVPDYPPPTRDHDAYRRTSSDDDRSRGRDEERARREEEERQQAERYRQVQSIADPKFQRLLEIGSRA